MSVAQLDNYTAVRSGASAWSNMYHKTCELATLSEPKVQFRYNDRLLPLLPLRVLPAHSAALMIALECVNSRGLERDRGGVIYVDLSAIYGFLDTEAVCHVFATLHGPHPRTVQAVKLNLMCAMHLVCETLGFDFDSLIRPRFFTFDLIERCRFVANNCCGGGNGTGTLLFADNHVYIDYSSPHATISGRFAYVLADDNAIRLFTDGNLTLRLVDGKDILLEYGRGPLYKQLFLNQTAHFLVHAPAVPHYG